MPWIALLLLVSVELAPGPRPAHADEEKSVLVLLQGQAGLPAATAVAAGIRSVLVREWSTRISIEVEPVDVLRFASTDYENQLRTLYHKYRDRHFDVVIAAGNEAVGFLLRSRREFPSDTPVVVCAVDERTLDGIAPAPGMTVATIRYDFEGTLQAALALLPDTRYVALFGGAAAPEQLFHRLARQAVTTLGRRLDLIDLTGLPLATVLARVAALPERTILLGSSFQVDGAGRRFDGVELFEPIAASANSPLFTPFGTALGRGAVGGSMVDFAEVGREAGAIVLGLLHGRAPSPRVQSAASNVLLFDGRQLDRWHLDDGRAPPGSRVLYRAPTLWVRYRWHVLLAVVLLAAQTVLIVGLLIERRRRRLKEGELAEQRRLEELERDIASLFTDLTTARMNLRLREALRRIARFLGADRGTIWRSSIDGRTWSPAYFWTDEGVAPPPASIEARAYPALARLAEHREVVILDGPGAIPEQAASERGALTRIGVRSLIGIPLSNGDRLLGLLAFASLRAQRAWPESLGRRLRTLGELFASALKAEETSAALASSEATSSAVLTALPGGAAILDHAGVIVQVNQAWMTLANGSSAGCMAGMTTGVNYLDACRSARATERDDTAKRAARVVESVVQEVQPSGVLEYACTVAGEDRWFEMRVERLPFSGGATVIHFDVTQRKRAEAEVRRHLGEMAHMYRVAEMAELASSLAHEITQPLTGILSNAQAASQLLAETPPDLAELRACLADIVEDDHRAAEVIRRMRLMLRKGVMESTLVDLDDIGRAVIDLVANDALLQQVSLEHAPATAPPLVMGDRIQLQQIVLNLLMNAVTAVAGGAAPRRVTLRTAVVEGEAELSVHDSGRGIDERDLERVFEPFFTTKSDGLGMGLAISRSIAKAHGGRLWAENDPTGGATFRFRLPIASASGAGA